MRTALLLLAGIIGCGAPASTSPVPAKQKLPAVPAKATYNGATARDWLKVARDKGQGATGIDALRSLYNEGGREAFIVLASEGSLDAVQELVARSADLSAYSEFMLPRARQVWDMPQWCDRAIAMRFVGLIGPDAAEFRDKVQPYTTDREKRLQDAADYALSRLGPAPKP